MRMQAGRHLDGRLAIQKYITHGALRDLFITSRYHLDITARSLQDPP